MKYLLFSVVLFLLASCGDSHRQDVSTSDEVIRGCAILAQARAHCLSGQYDAARDSVLSLRRTCPHAIQARRQAILLLDSVEWLAARDSLMRLPERMDTTLRTYSSEYERLSVKVQFYQRKLQHDTRK